MLNNFFRINMPYVIRGNNKDGWLTLNREYKPLGFNNPTDYVHYDDYAIKSKFNITKSKIEKLKSLGANISDISNSNDVFIFLYDDGNNPSDAPMHSYEVKIYFEKLDLLMRLENNIHKFELKESIKSEKAKR